MGFSDEVRVLNKKLPLIEKKFDSLNNDVSEAITKNIQAKSFLPALLRVIKENPQYVDLQNKLDFLQNHTEQINKAISVEKISNVVDDRITGLASSDEFTQKVAGVIAKNLESEIKQSLQNVALNMIGEIDFSPDLKALVKEKGKECMQEALEEMSDLHLRARLAVISMNLALKLYLFKGWLPLGKRHLQKEING